MTSLVGVVWQSKRELVDVGVYQLNYGSETVLKSDSLMWGEREVTGMGVRMSKVAAG
jgi:hypothetical protein